MATYTNLASLEGLQVGDVVNYTTTTAFDAKGYKFRIALNGSSSGTGGLTEFVIDTSKLPETILSYNSRGDLIYGTDTGFYYRIAVAGNAGGAGTKGVLASGGSGGKGGGLTGGTGKSGGENSGGAGGGQTSGYAFGNGGYASGTCPGGSGGYGWYGGQPGENGYFDGGAGGGGGSGFIIGFSTTTYPSGYLGNDTALQQTIASSITEGKLTQGGSTGLKMVLTIESTGQEGESLSTLKYFNGTDFIDTNAKYYNGSELVNCNVYYFDGTELKKI